MTPVEKARQAFDKYAAMDAPGLPDHPVAALQVQLCRWQARKFGYQPVERQVNGVSEELGEFADEVAEVLELCTQFAKNVGAVGRLNHATLKHSQSIRGLSDKEAFREKAGDALADNMVFTMQNCTSLRLDFWTLLVETANEVMNRQGEMLPGWTDVNSQMVASCSTWLEDSTGACVTCGRPRSAHPGIELR